MKRINIEHAIIHAAYQALAAIVYSFGAYMLIERGLSATLAGFCISLANLLGLNLQIFGSNFLDESDKWNVISYAFVCTIIASIMFLINHLVVDNKIIMSIAYICGGGIFCSLEPLINSFGFKFKNKGLNVEFGKARAVGSISFGVACSIFGYLSDIYSFSVVTLFGFIFCLSLLISIFTFKREYDSMDDVFEEKKHENISFKEFISNHKEFIILCLFSTGLFLGYTCNDNFMLLICENVNGTTSDMGNVLAFKAIIEGFAIIFISKIMKKFNIRKMLMIAALFFAVKSFAIYMAKDVLGLFIAEAFQVVSFALILPLMVELVNNIMNYKESVRGQAMFTMTISTGSILSSFFAGLISDSLGTSAMCLFAFIISLISAIGFCITINKVK